MTDASKSDTEKRDKSLRDFATVLAGYVAGHGVLRLFAGFLSGLGDAPRADLLLRWLPVWNALGWFVAAWALYRLVMCLGGLEPAIGNVRRGTQEPVSTSVNAGADVGEAVSQRQALSNPENRKDPIRPTEVTAGPPWDWKEQIKGLQKGKDIGALLEVQKSLSQSLPGERAEQLNRRLGRWYTKHFQHVMLTGRAAESLGDVERVAEYYADSEEFAYFREVLPVVRQCAELKQSLQDEE